MMFLTDLRAQQPARKPAAPAFAPALDLVEGPEAFAIHLELPGIDPATIDLTLNGKELTVSGEKPQTQHEGATWHRRERTWGRFERTFTFPTAVTGVEAQTHHGVLTITVAKAPEAIARKIPITVVQ
jgi:HSP20 family protein